MYLNPQIHDTQDTLTIHVGYIGIHSRIRISSPTCGHLLPRADHQPPDEAVQRALSAQVGSDEHLEEEGGAHGGEQSEGTPVPALQREPQVEPDSRATKRRSDFSSLGSRADRTSPGYVS